MGIAVKIKLEISNRLKQLYTAKLATPALQKSIREVSKDLLRVGMERAPYKTGTLEHSGTVKFSGTGSNYEGVVSFCAVNDKGVNYARTMDRDFYNLGKKSLEKATRQARSQFCNKSLKVGMGYLSDSAKACQIGYRKHIKQSILTSVQGGR